MNVSRRDPILEYNNMVPEQRRSARSCSSSSIDCQLPRKRRGLESEKAYPSSLVQEDEEDDKKTARRGGTVLTLAVRRGWHPAAGIHVRLRLQMTDDRVPVQNRDCSRVIRLRRYTVTGRKPGQLAPLVPCLLFPQLLPTSVECPLERGAVLVTMDIPSSASAIRQRLPVMHEISIGGGRVRDQRPVIAVTSRRLPAHVALPPPILVRHVRDLDLAASTPASPLDLLVDGLVLVRQVPRQVHVLAVVGVQLMMARPVHAPVDYLRVFVLVRQRGSPAAPAATGRPVAAHLVPLVDPSRAAVPPGVAQGHRVVRPGRVFLLGTAVPGVPGIRFKRNVLRERQIKILVSDCEITATSRGSSEYRVYGMKGKTQSDDRRV